MFAIHLENSKFVLRLALSIVVFAMGLLAFSLFIPTTAHASSNGAVNKKLNMGDNSEDIYFSKTFTSYDITGDGINDELTIEYDPNGSSYILTMYVNGKAAFSHEYGIYVYGGAPFNVKYLRLKNGKPFIALNAANAVVSATTDVLVYKNGKLKKALTKKNKVIPKSFYISDENAYASGNRIEVKYSLRIYGDILMGSRKITGTYQLKDGTFKVSNKKCGSLKYKKFKMKKTAKLYSSLKLKKSKGKVLKKTKVRVGTATVRNGSLYFWVKANGKSGWVKAASVDMHYTGWALGL